MAKKSKKDKAKAKKVQYTSTKEVIEKQESGFEPTAFLVPEGMKLWKFKKEGTYKINIIPFRVGKNNPFADEGMVHFERTYWVHNNIGPEQKRYACLAKNFGKKCPICRQIAKMRANPKSNEDAVKALEPRERQLWIFQDARKPDDGLFIFEASHYKGFGELLKAKLKTSDEEDNYDSFFHLEGGKTLKVGVEEDTFMGRTFMKPTSIDMKDREEDLEESILDEAPCLDDLVIEMDFKELQDIFLQSGEKDEDDDDDDDKDKKSKKKKDKKKPKKDEDDDEEEEDEGDDDDEEEDGDDDEESDEDDSESEGDDDDDDDGDDEGEEEEEDEPEIVKGSMVTFKWKGKKQTGKVIKVKKGVAQVKAKDGSWQHAIKVGKLTLIEEEEEEDATADEDDSEFEEESDDDDDDEEEDEDEKPKKKKAKKTKKVKVKKKKVEEDDEDEDEDDDDDEPFEEEE